MAVKQSTLMLLCALIYCVRYTVTSRASCTQLQYTLVINVIIYLAILANVRVRSQGRQMFVV